MSPIVSTADLALLAALAGAGLLLGLAYFAALWRTVALLAGGSSWLAPVALTVGRLAGAVALLAAAVRWGAPDLLAVFAGILLARLIAVRVVRRAG